MKKIVLSLFIISALLMVGGGMAYAETPFTQHTLPDTDAAGVMVTISKVANWVFTILIIAAVFVVLISAFTFVTGGGDPAQVTKARTMLIWAAVGIIVALLAKGFPLLIRNFVTGT